MEDQDQDPRQYITMLRSLAKNPDEANKLEAEHAHVTEQLLRTTWEEMVVIENNDDLLFPEKIYRRRADGSFEGTPVLVCIPKEEECRRARVDARKLALKKGLDLDRDVDLIDNLETSCLMALCIRNAQPGKDPRGGVFYEPFELNPERLEKVYVRSSLTHLWANRGRVTTQWTPSPIPSRGLIAHLRSWRSRNDRVVLRAGCAAPTCQRGGFTSNAPRFRIRPAQDSRCRITAGRSHARRKFLVGTRIAQSGCAAQ